MRGLFAAFLLAFCVQTAAEERIDTEQLRLQFSDRGDLIAATSCFPDCEAPDALRVRFDGPGMALGLGSGSEAEWTVRRERPAGQHRLTFLSSSGQSLTWSVPQQGYLMDLQATGLKSLSMIPGPGVQPRDSAGFGRWLESLRGVDLRDDGEGWIGYRSRYWALMLRVSGSAAVVEESEESQSVQLVFSPNQESAEFRLYAGPVEPRVLAAADRELQGTIYSGLWEPLRWICLGLFYLLAWLRELIPSWGLAIMALSLVVHVLMLPLSRLADRFQQQVNRTEARLAPKLREIRQSFSGEEQAERTLALYRTEGVHPLYSLKSLLGVAVVIPIFIGAFDMLAENIHLFGQGFLWISDLSLPDAVLLLPFALPFFGGDLNALPFVMTALSLWASALHQPEVLDSESRRRQVRNMVLLALLFFLLFYTFPAGMVLYWACNNLISVVRSLMQRRYNGRESKEVPDDG